MLQVRHIIKSYIEYIESGVKTRQKCVCINGDGGVKGLWRFETFVHFREIWGSKHFRCKFIQKVDVFSGYRSYVWRFSKRTLLTPKKNCWGHGPPGPSVCGGPAGFKQPIMIE